MLVRGLASDVRRRFLQKSSGLTLKFMAKTGIWGRSPQKPELLNYCLGFRQWNWMQKFMIYFGRIILFSDTKLDACTVSRGLGAQPPEARALELFFRLRAMKFDTEIKQLFRQDYSVPGSQTWCLKHRSRGLGAQPPETRAFKPLFRPWSMKFDAKIHDIFLQIRKIPQ